MFIVSFNGMMTALSDSSAVLSIFMHVTGVLKGHDMMNQNLTSFYCLLLINYILSFPLILSTYATSSSVWSTQCEKVGMNIKNWNMFDYYQ